MPVSRERERERSGRYSCDFCRTRKLRCDRPLPCTSCKSRGKVCRVASPSAVPVATRGRNDRRGCSRGTPTSPGAASTPANAPERAQEHQGQLRSSPTPQLSHPYRVPPSLSSPAQNDLLAEVQALRLLAEQLEKRVIQSTTNPKRCHQRDGEPAITPPIATPSDGGPTSQPGLEQVSHVVAHLQRVSMGQASLEPISTDCLTFKVESIRNIPQAITNISHLGRATPCVWLPRHAEAKTLVDNYIADLSYIQHVVHYPSLPATIDHIYRQLHNLEPVPPGHIVLLLSIVANATHVWAPHEHEHSDSALFLSSAQANSQTPLWIKSTYAVINSAQNSTEITLETVQGIAILSFIISNLEGVSLRYRSLISTGLQLGRELGLHRIDSEVNAGAPKTVQKEMGRRLWWYLVATDWLLAARYGGPGEGVYQCHPLQMTVNKPRNIDDVDLIDNEPQLDLPTSRPTDMSYFLQRLRLAEISRSIVDHNLMHATSHNRPSYYAHVVAMDVELDRMLQNAPSFFQLDSYDGSSESSRTSDIFVQAYMLNSLIHTSRCKLHISYLTSGPNNNPAHASSRDTCLKSATQIIRAERQLMHSQHPYVRVRLRLAAILHSVFMASIVLLMDACVNRTNYTQEEVLQGDVAEALSIIEDARNHSLAAANLLESLNQILAKHRHQHQPHRKQHKQQQQQLQQKIPTLQQQTNLSTMPFAPSSYQDSACAPQQQQQPNVTTLFTPNSAHNSHNDPDRAFSIGPSSVAGNEPTNSLEDTPLFMNDIQWDDLFSGIISSSFF